MITLEFYLVVFCRERCHNYPQFPILNLPRYPAFSITLRRFQSIAEWLRLKYRGDFFFPGYLAHSIFQSVHNITWNVLMKRLAKLSIREVPSPNINVIRLRSDYSHSYHLSIFKLSLWKLVIDVSVFVYCTVYTYIHPNVNTEHM
jgi:hypothetical protein